MKLTNSTTTTLYLLVTILLIEPSSGISRPFTLKSSTPQQQSPKSMREPLITNKSTVARKNSKSGGPKDNNNGVVSQVVDYGAILKYTTALTVQATLSVGMWMCVDWGYLKMKAFPSRRSPSNHRWFRIVLTYFLNATVGIFNPLPTTSDKIDGRTNSPGRIRPSWTPPGWVFVLMWPLFVFGTRAWTMVVVADKVGRFVNPVTISMMVHFAIGGVWSHVNRIEEQLGISMILLYALFASKAYTAWLAWQIDPTAGIALACTLSWLGAAAALGTATWRLNPDPPTGQTQPLVPMTRKK